MWILPGYVHAKYEVVALTVFGVITVPLCTNIQIDTHTMNENGVFHSLRSTQQGVWHYIHRSTFMIALT